MPDQKLRYFIELHPGAEEAFSRHQIYARRRAQALATVTHLRSWLLREGLERKVALLSPTAFGQVQITCEPDVMERIRDDETMPISVIRQGSLINWVVSRA